MRKLAIILAIIGITLMSSMTAYAAFKSSIVGGFAIVGLFLFIAAFVLSIISESE